MYLRIRSTALPPLERLTLSSSPSIIGMVFSSSLSSAGIFSSWSMGFNTISAITGFPASWLGVNLPRKVEGQFPMFTKTRWRQHLSKHPGYRSHVGFKNYLHKKGGWNETPTADDFAFLSDGSRLRFEWNAQGRGKVELHTCWSQLI